MYNFIGDNPTTLYKNALDALIKEGDEVRPRDKLVKELRPTAIEFTNPLNRTTFLGTRKINPFFQIAESLWIISGRADVDWLTKFNANMATFSDDGKFFNASYGERIVCWGNNSPRGVKSDNQLNQIIDVYKRFIADKDTRQATIAIGNPSFDNYDYLVGGGKDIACNLYITFKIRHNKLTMTVFNRSNDLHWGTFGANLCQFTTIQELLCSMLRNSGCEKFENLELGTYCQFTDSLHIYMEDYGAKINDEVLNYYNEHEYVEPHFECKNEPRMNMSIYQFAEFIQEYWKIIDPLISDDKFFTNVDYGVSSAALDSLIESFRQRGIIDDYWAFACKSMYLYRHYKMGNYKYVQEILDELPSCMWKISMMHFIKDKMSKELFSKDSNSMSHYQEQVATILDDLVDEDSRDAVRSYIEI